MKKDKILTETQQEADNYFIENAQEAKKDDTKMYDLYRKYVGTAETPEERLRRIHKFRCGG